VGAATAAGVDCEREFRILLPGGVVRHVFARAVLLRGADRRVSGAVGTVEDVTERTRAERALRERLRQQAAVAALGRLALCAVSVDDLLAEAVRLVRSALCVDVASVLELRPGVGLAVRAFDGSWPGGPPDPFVGAGPRDSIGGHALATREPVVMLDAAAETRFTVPTRRRRRSARGATR
jgi:PAS domain-containing protein